MTYRWILSLALSLLLLPASAQRPRYDKLSPMLRQLVRSHHCQPSATARPSATPRYVCALVKTTDEEALHERGCRVWTSVGDICVATIPIASLGELTHDSRICRIEASRGKQAQTDSMAIHLNATDVYQGLNLPQAYTGEGVVVGLMDIGFDLTHPTFYSRDLSRYRIQRLWDMLSTDTVDSTFPVGRDYAGASTLLALGHSRDGLTQSHGTHTLGIATGSGYDSPYQGMAPQTDICLVANATSNNAELIDSADYYKYTFATDALGFKYLFDYAQSTGRPCVVSFSEGSGEDFWGYDQLYFEMLSRLVGPGRIMVASAGNQGRKRSWFLKPVGDGTMGTFLRAHEPEMMVTLKAAADFDFRLVGYTGHGDTLTINSQQVCLQEDSVLTTTFLQDDQLLAISIEAYPSCYDSAETCYDLLLLGKNSVGSTPRLALEVLSSGSDVEVYRVSGLFNTYDNNPLLTAGECTHNVLSPSTAPCVISVGGTIYRQGITNYQGKWITGEAGSGGERGTYSSVGPTMDGRIKPDVMAPGANIISSWSSFYLENHPDENDRTWDVAYFDFDGRTYAWQASGGTSMSAPAVAGAIALWLQAKPDLTPDEVLGVLSRTARHPDETLSYPNNYYGYGEIDVYRGLLDILGADAIEELSQHPSKARMTVADGRLSLLLEQPSEHPLRLRVFSLSGRLLTDVRVPARQTTPAVSLAGLPAGVYAVQVDGDDALTGSSLIRWP